MCVAKEQQWQNEMVHSFTHKSVVSPLSHSFGQPATHQWAESLGRSGSLLTILTELRNENIRLRFIFSDLWSDIHFKGHSLSLVGSLEVST